MASNKTYLCNRCKDTGVYQDGFSAMTCPYCAGRQKFMAHLKQAIKQASAGKRKTLKEDLVAVHELLPEYPVMACLEAEARGLRRDFIDFIMESFDVRPLREPVDRFV
jgi:DNA-directed RNA polymerase subunit RPC12/RpoP